MKPWQLGGTHDGGESPIVASAGVVARARGAMPRLIIETTAPRRTIRTGRICPRGEAPSTYKPNGLGIHCNESHIHRPPQVPRPESHPAQVDGQTCASLPSVIERGIFNDAPHDRGWSNVVLTLALPRRHASVLLRASSCQHLPQDTVAGPSLQKLVTCDDAYESTEP